MRIRWNPKGIRRLSPGLRGTSRSRSEHPNNVFRLPLGSSGAPNFTTPTGLRGVSQRGVAVVVTTYAWNGIWLLEFQRNPVGVDSWVGPVPRGNWNNRIDWFAPQTASRTRQPWAWRRNPCGILGKSRLPPKMREQATLTRPVLIRRMRPAPPWLLFYLVQRSAADLRHLNEADKQSELLDGFGEFLVVHRFDDVIAAS